MDLLALQEILHDLFVYENGHLYWRTSGSGRNHEVPAGARESDGYRSVQVQGKRYKMHRAVWIYHYGWIPKALDHINGDRADNRIENLRPCNTQQNGYNRSPSKDKMSKGISFRPARWRACIGVDSHTIQIGEFETQEEAQDAYDAVAREWAGDYSKPTRSY